MAKLHDIARADAEDTALSINRETGIIYSGHDLTLHSIGFCNGYRKAIKDVLAAIDHAGSVYIAKDIINNIIQ